MGIKQSEYVIHAQVYFKAKRIDNGEWVVGFFTKKKIGSLIVPVIEVYKEWDSGDYMETYEIDGETLINYTIHYRNKSST